MVVVLGLMMKFSEDRSSGWRSFRTLDYEKLMLNQFPRSFCSHLQPIIAVSNLEDGSIGALIDRSSSLAHREDRASYLLACDRGTARHIFLVSIAHNPALNSDRLSTNQ